MVGLISRVMQLRRTSYIPNSYTHKYTGRTTNADGAKQQIKP